MEKPSSTIWKRNKTTKGKHMRVLKLHFKLLDNIDKVQLLLHRNSVPEGKKIREDIFQYKLQKQ